MEVVGEAIDEFGAVLEFFEDWKSSKSSRNRVEDSQEEEIFEGLLKRYVGITRKLAIDLFNQFDLYVVEKNRNPLIRRSDGKKDKKVHFGSRKYKIDLRSTPEDELPILRCINSLTDDQLTIVNTLYSGAMKICRLILFMREVKDDKPAEKGEQIVTEIMNNPGNIVRGLLTFSPNGSTEKEIKIYLDVTDSCKNLSGIEVYHADEVTFGLKLILAKLKRIRHPYVTAIQRVEKLDEIRVQELQTWIPQNAQDFSSGDATECNVASSSWTTNYRKDSGKGSASDSSDDPEDRSDDEGFNLDESATEEGIPGIAGDIELKAKQKFESFKEGLVDLTKNVKQSEKGSAEELKTASDDRLLLHENSTPVAPAHQSELTDSNLNMRWTLLYGFMAIATWPTVSTIGDQYMNNTVLNEMLRQMARDHSSLATVYSIGKSFLGTDLLVVRLAGPHVPIGTPHVKLIGNIHGNEPLGREILYRLANHLIQQYEAGEAEARWILDKMYVHILPTMNPDGFQVSLEGVCDLGPGRRNANGVDLNRNFPSERYPDDVTTAVQPETQAVMEWMYKVPFLLSAGLHGGTVVANYPYDMAATKDSKNLEHKTEDDELFKFLASNYSETHGHMALMDECQDEPDVFHAGIVNGAAWYPVTGSMQDYNYDFHGCLELTLELSCCKYPGSHELERYWKENKEPLLAFLKHSQLGVKGVVRNGTEPVAKAAVSIFGEKSFRLTSEFGEYWKLLMPGKYFLQVEKEGFQTVVKKVSIPLLPSDNPVVLNIDLAEATNLESAGSSGLDAIDPELVDDNDWLSSDWVDTRGVQEYDQVWRTKVEERKRKQFLEEEMEYNAGLKHRCSNICWAVYFIFFILALT